MDFIEKMFNDNDIDIISTKDEFDITTYSFRYSDGVNGFVYNRSVIYDVCLINSYETTEVIEDDIKMIKQQLKPYLRDNKLKQLLNEK